MLPKTPRPEPDPYDRIADAQPYDYEKIPYIVPGVYPLLYVALIKAKFPTRKGDNVIIAEFDILDSKVDTRPPGTPASYIWNLRHDAAPREIKKFIAAVMNSPIEEVDSAGIKYACSAENPCRGRLVHLVATEKKSDKTKNLFTGCSFSPISDDVQSRAEQLRGEAGF
jgi:hypothetical protein